MPTSLIPIILQYALQYGIPAARDVVNLLYKPAPTLQDWNSMFDASEANALKFLAQTAALAASTTPVPIQPPPAAPL